MDSVLVHAPTPAEQLETAREDYIEARRVRNYNQDLLDKDVDELEEAHKDFEHYLFEVMAEYGDDECVDVTEKEKYKIKVEHLQRKVDLGRIKLDQALTVQFQAADKLYKLKQKYGKRVRFDRKLHYAEEEPVYAEDMEYNMVLDELQKRAQECFDKHGNIGTMMEDIDEEDPQ